jgi:hypothetical protein
MNKWEDSFKSNVSNEQGCHCSSTQGLFVPNRHLSFLVAGLLFLFFGIFMTGYFWGKKNVVEQFAVQVEQDAFADQVYTSVIATATTDESFAPSAFAKADALESKQEIHTLLITDAEIIEAAPGLSINQEIVVENDTSLMAENSITRYYAQLIGFGTEKAAQAFVKKLSAKGIETEVRQRASKTVKGRTSHWYQVVTCAYANKDELVKLVDRITKEENIKDASIRAC